MDHFLTVFSPFVFCLLILLAGVNVPISIDLVLITAGAFSCGEVTRTQTSTLFLLLFLACWVSAWEAYWMGRLIGPTFRRFKWFKTLFSQKRIDRLQRFYEKYGVLTFFFVRFIPCGVRNALFVTSGLSKMPFLRFIMRDLPGCFLSSALLFYLGLVFAQHHETLFFYFKTYKLIALFILFLISLVFFLKKMRRTRKPMIFKEEKSNIQDLGSIVK